MSEGQMPDWIVNSVVATGKKGDDGKEISRWNSIGVGFNNRESITLLLDALPVNARMVLTKPKPRDDPQPTLPNRSTENPLDGERIA